MIMLKMSVRGLCLEFKILDILKSLKQNLRSELLTLRINFQVYSFCDFVDVLDKFDCGYRRYIKKFRYFKHSTYINLQFLIRA